MPSRAAAIAFLVAAALAAEGALLHGLVAAPLASAVAALEAAPRTAVFGEEITVVAPRRARSGGSRLVARGAAAPEEAPGEGGEPLTAAASRRAR